ncbi:MAG: CAP domain-containing protein [Deltaproteobacteria bacterium]|nr:CAP domain-containing protein [Deltaproteobacteria bacterium]
MKQFLARWIDTPLSFSVLVLLATSSAACDQPTHNTEFEREVLSLINEQRTAGVTCGNLGEFPSVPALVMNEKLREAARTHSVWMGRGGVSHKSSGGPIGDTPDQRMERAGYSGWWALGENVAAGQTSPSEVVGDWMESERHCANIMNRAFSEVGIGYAYVKGTYWTYWTQDFGAARGTGK